jgi:hypothetical protein
MPALYVTKTWSKAGGSFSSEQADPFAVDFAFSDGWQVVLSEPDDDAHRVAQEAVGLGMPNFGDQHISGVNSFVTDMTPTRVGPITWLIMLGYKGISDDTSTVDVEWGDVTTTEPVDRDINGYAIVTANGEQVDGLSMDVADQVVVIRRKFLTINTASIREYRRATNSDTYLGWPAGTARLIGFSAKNQFKYGAARELWDVTARIQFREPLANTTSAQAWYKRWRHEGLLVSEGGRIVRARDENQQEVTKPVLLKSDGTLETDPNAAYFVHTQVYGSLPYSALGLV